jgi:long-chain acyl-CoA synthetase
MDAIENINTFDIETNTLEIKNQICVKCDLQTHSDDVAMLMHTSGSSDKPKRVMLTNRNVISNVEANIEVLNIKENDRTLISLPMYFSYCNTAQLLSHMYVGAQIVILDTIFLPHIFFSIVEKEKITNFMTVPTIAKTLLNYSNQKPIPSLKWISIGGAPIDNETLKKLIESFKNIEFIKTYGLTEASPRVSTLLSKDCRTKTASIGKPMKGIEVKIILENGNEAKEYEKGELLLKGDNIMKGYYKNTQETAKAIKNGWLHTGDIGYYDKDGFIYLSGRKKNIIISNGINIYPEEIEDVLMSHHAVEQAYVYGILNETYGEIPEAKIVIKKETAISDIELLQYCREKLSDYKIPTKIIFVDKLQYTNNMKIKRTESLNVK